MKSNDQYHSSSHALYLVQYHLVWCPKFRYPVLVDGVDLLLKDILHWIASNYGFVIKAMEVMPDHVHLFLDAPHTLAPCRIAQIFKSISARELFNSVPWLRSYYSRCQQMWSDGYFISSIGTVGTVSEETVRRYIEGQKRHHG